MRNKDSVQCSGLAEAPPLDRQGMNHSRRERRMQGKKP